MVREIELTQGRVALVDGADYAWLNQFKWCALRGRNQWYAVRHRSKGEKRGAIIYMHREIAGVGDREQVDHVDLDGLHNYRSNLRACTRTENQCNRPAPRNNTSGFKGVYWHKREQKWRARIYLGGKCIHLSLFSDPILAALAYDDAARKYHGEFAWTNFLEV